MSVREIGDTGRDGLLEIVDTNWNHNGTLRVTVRELIGQPWDSYPGGRNNVLRRARTLARGALMYRDKTRSSRVIRTFTAGGSSFVTFAVSRNA